MNTNHTNKRHGFTLIEMVGVLAVIAILAALLVPKIFSAIEESKYNNTVGSINNLKAATMAYFAKNSAFPLNAGPFDQTLITANELERPFAAKLGTKWTCESLAAAAAGVANGNRFSKLDGDQLAAAGTVVQVKLDSVPAADAWELSKRIDGAGMSATATQDDPATVGIDESVPATDKADDQGRVTYAQPANGVTDVYVYIAHK